MIKYAFKSVKEVAKKCGVDSPKFLRFLDEQLMITAQAKSEETPFLFGAPGLTYTNYSNFYVPGGLIQMINTIKDYVEEKGGALHTKEAVLEVSKEGGKFLLKNKKGDFFKSSIVISNIPIWNMKDITSGEIQSYFEKEAKNYDKAWGAITMGIATTDTYPNDLEIHHQIHLDVGISVPYADSKSLFVSMSKKGDEKRAPKGESTLNISCHASPETWFAMDEEEYKMKKLEVQEFILSTLNGKLRGFSKAEIKLADTATPVSWENWVYRKKGRVGGVPQSVARSLLNWTPN